MPHHHCEIVAADVHAVAGTQHLGRDDGHQVQYQKDDAGDHRGPQKAAAVFPEFAFHEPVEGFHA